MQEIVFLTLVFVIAAVYFIYKLIPKKNKGCGCGCCNENPKNPKSTLFYEQISK